MLKVKCLIPACTFETDDLNPVMVAALITTHTKVHENTKVKSGKFRHTFANSVNPAETAPYELSHQDFHCLLS